MSKKDRPPEILKAVGARLRQFRVGLGMTQEQLAREIGQSRGAINSWESGTRMLNVLVAVEISERWNVPLDWLYRGQGWTSAARR